MRVIRRVMPVSVIGSAFIGISVVMRMAMLDQFES